MMRRAYQVAQLSEVSQTAFVECHSTGTAVGDPLEVAAIATIFGHEGIYIGSVSHVEFGIYSVMTYMMKVKPNVGHSEGASGTTSLIKAVLALEHRVIPPNIIL